ncbi:S-layer homology domain-containing protein [Aciduricibacillus chroicocephali]|uniref:S-layer homology domain-containing protein n=1 Tax=Aciduricibacillus chroicocephali TaxID=3054939 RepID=A0ABY9KXT6_9BACI|nr:S-layer homology domain-containing protein [Bacillaceae bacterium 44XB]
MSSKKNLRKVALSTMAASAAVVAVAPAVSAADKSFSDVSTSNDHYGNINKLTSEGVISGYPDGTFKPYNSISRAQIAAIFTKALDLKVPEDLATALKDYKDINATSEYAKEIAAVTQAGIFKGNEQGKFNPYAPITREQMATVLVEGFQLKQFDKGEKVDVKLSNVSPSHRDNVQILANLGLTNQLKDYRPFEQVRRDSFTTFVVNTRDAVAPKIVELEAPAEITVDQGKTASLPETVKAKYDNDTTGDVKVKWDTTNLDTNKVGTYTVTGTVEGTDKTVDAKVVVRATEVTVESVKAINASEVEVTYNVDVDKDSAGDAANYNVEKNTGTTTAITVDDVKVTGKTALLRLATPLNPSDKFVVGVKDAVRSTDGLKLKAYSTPTMVFGDVTAPKLQKAALGDNGETLQFTFDKPVKTDVTLVKVDGLSLTDKSLEQFGTDEAGNYTYTVSVSASEKATVAKQGNHEVTLFDVSETSTTNPAVASVLNANYSVSDKTVSAPEVKAVTPLNGNKFFVEFNKPATLADSASLEVKKGNHTFTATEKNATITSVNSDAAQAYYKKGEYEKKPGYYVVITDNYNDASNNPLYAKGEDTVQLNVNVKNYKDSDGLIGSPYNGAVTLKKSTDKPAVAATVLDAAASSGKGAVYLDFDRAIQSTATNAPTTFQSTDVVVRDKDGVIVPSGDYSVSRADRTNTSGATTVANGRLAITFDGKTNNYAKDSAPFTVEVKADKVQYAPELGNVVDYQVAGAKNDKLTATVKATDADNFKYVQFKSKLADDTTDSITASADNAITIDYQQDMDASAADKSNYLLDGKALPTNATVDFIGDKSKVQIKLPAETVKEDSSYKLTISNSVKTKDGRYVVNNTVEQKSYEQLIGLKDNVSPQIEGKAIYVVPSKDATQSDKVKVTFSENVSVNGTATGKVKENFKFVLNSTDIAVTAVNAGDEQNELVLTLDRAININQAATVTVVKDSEGNINVKDGNSNKLVEGGKANITSNEKEVDAAKFATETTAVDSADQAVTQSTFSSALENTVDTQTAAEDAVKSLVDSAIASSGATASIKDVSFTAPTAGNAGSIKFKVEYSKGAVTKKSEEFTQAITAK